MGHCLQASRSTCLQSAARRDFPAPHQHLAKPELRGLESPEVRAHQPKHTRHSGTSCNFSFPSSFCYGANVTFPPGITEQ